MPAEIMFKIGQTVYGVNQPGMSGNGIVTGIFTRGEVVTGYSEVSPEGSPCYEVYVGPKDQNKSISIFDFRLFDIEDVFATRKGAEKRYFVKSLQGESVIKDAG